MHDVLGYSESDEMSREKLDLLYRVLDTNRDGFLDTNELERVQLDVMHHGFASSKLSVDVTLCGGSSMWL